MNLLKLLNCILPYDKRGAATYPRGCLSSSLRTVCSQNSNTKCSRLFLLNTSSRLTRFTCFSCCRPNRECGHRISNQNMSLDKIFNPDTNLGLSKLSTIFKTDQSCVFLLPSNLFLPMQLFCRYLNFLHCTWHITWWSNT